MHEDRVMISETDSAPKADRRVGNSSEAARDCVRDGDERSTGLEEEQARIFAKTSRDASVSAQSDDGARHEHGDHPPLSIFRYAGSMNRWIGARPIA